MESRGDLASWSAAASSLWAKSSLEENAWLPLVQHLDDSAGVAGVLWDRWLPEQTKRFITQAISGDDADGRALACWLAGVHDVGKSSPAFACVVPELAEATRKAGGDLSPQAQRDRKRAPHGAVGEWALATWLQDAHGARPRVAASYAAVVGAHHGSAPDSYLISQLEGAPWLTGNDVWADARREILAAMATRTGASPRLPTWSRTSLSPAAQMLLTGIVIVSDWIASNEDCFPYTTPNQPLEATPRRVAGGWSAVGLPDAWRPVSTRLPTQALMQDRFPQLAAVPNAMQHRVHALAEEMPLPGLMMIEAPMGHGKTEAALMAAEVLAARSGAGGVFLGLPTMATTDAMFSRLRAWIDRLPVQGPVSLQLAHSKGQLNEEFAALPRQLPITGALDESGTDRSCAIAANWLQSRKRGTLATFVVGTIDQALFVALQAKHVMLRHLALSGKVVVIDEVHAADDYMRIYLTSALAWLGRYGVPVVLLSATLPSHQRCELVAAYSRGLGEELQLEPAASYPCLTVVGPGRADSVPVEATGPSMRLEVQGLSDDLQELIEYVARVTADGGVVGIVRNTVARAQDAYRVLRERFAEDEVLLLHSRFLAPHRAARESLLRSMLGPRGARPHRLIVVGTQVLEQSLDVDFDLLISDLAPVDLLLQRVGRLHRHPRSRPPHLQVPRLLITGYQPGEAGGPPTLEPGGRAVYGTSLLLRTAAAINLGDTGDASGVEHHSFVELPGEIRSLVERVYAETPYVPAAWLAEVRTADEARSREILDARQRAETFCLPAAPRAHQCLNSFLNVSLDEDAVGQRQVRDGEEGLEVLAIQRVAGELRLLPQIGEHSGQRIPDLGPPGSEMARAIATCSLRLPRQCTWPARQLDATIADLERLGLPQFQQSGWLSGQLVVIFDEQLHATVAGVGLSYDIKTGLRVVSEQ